MRFWRCAYLYRSYSQSSWHFQNHLKQPEGSCNSWKIFAKIRADIGVSSEGFAMTQHPAACHSTFSSQHSQGKIQGVIIADTHWALCTRIILEEEAGSCAIIFHWSVPQNSYTIENILLYIWLLQWLSKWFSILFGNTITMSCSYFEAVSLWIVGRTSKSALLFETVLVLVCRQSFSTTFSSQNGRRTILFCVGVLTSKVWASREKDAFTYGFVGRV